MKRRLSLSALSGRSPIALRRHREQSLRANTELLQGLGRWAVPIERESLYIATYSQHSVYSLKSKNELIKRARNLLTRPSSLS